MNLDATASLKVYSYLDGSFRCCPKFEGIIGELDFFVPSSRYVHGCPGIDVEIIIQAEGVTAAESNDVSPIAFLQAARFFSYLSFPLLVTRADPPALETFRKIVINDEGFYLEFIVFETGLRRETGSRDLREHEPGPPVVVTSHG